MRLNPRVTAAFTLAVIGLAGTVAAHYEGYEPNTYRDVADVLTACRGHTGSDVKAGASYSPEQCDAWFSADLKVAAEGVFRCVTVPLSINEAAAFSSATFNIGTTAFCRSSMARKANAGDMKGACDALLLYVWAGGKKVAGLIKRRATEHALCLKP